MSANFPKQVTWPSPWPKFEEWKSSSPCHEKVARKLYIILLQQGSPPGFPVPGILQARTLEWVAIYITKCPLGNTVTPRWELLFYGDPSRTKEFQFRDCSCGPRRRNSSLDADGNHGDDKKCLGSKIYFEVRASGIFWRIRCGMREIEEPKMTWNFWSGHLRQWQFCHQN